MSGLDAAPVSTMLLHPVNTRVPTKQSPGRLGRANADDIEKIATFLPRRIVRYGGAVTEYTVTEYTVTEYTVTEYTVTEYTVDEARRGKVECYYP